MSTIPALQSALYGLKESLRTFDETASRIARETAVGDLGHLAENFVDLMTAEAGVSANVAVARSADEMTGTLLDLLA